ncbi:MAG: sulfatase-like hydrolase/transferase, partial [Kiritimatiellales bacterium]
MKKKAFLATATLALAASVPAGGKPVRPPNILFIFSDDHATQAIGAYGGRLAPFNPTPNIDRIANEGVIFRESFCGNSLCQPSRATV